MRDRDDGFSLAELLVALVIIGVLSAIVIMSTSSTSTNAPASCEADFQAVRTASEAYYASNANTFAPDIPTLRSSQYLRSDPPVKPAAGPITTAVAPNGYALELSAITGEPTVHVWGTDEVWATGDDASGGSSICTDPSAGL